MRLAVNAHRLRGAAMVEHAIEKGVRIFDVLGSQHRTTRLVLEALRAHPEARIIAKVGYFEVNDETRHWLAGGRQVSEVVGHSLAPDFVAAEAAQLVELAGREVDVLLHHPEACDNPFGALEALRGIGGRVGVSTNAPASLVDAKGPMTVVRAPASALDDVREAEIIASLAARFEVVGHRPFLWRERRLVDQPLESDAPTLQQTYVDACARALARFTPPDEMDDPETREGCAWIQQLVADLNTNVANFTSFEMWEREIATQIVPMLHDKFQELDEDSADHLQNFFRAYGQVVRWHANVETRKLCGLLNADDSLADWALATLRRRYEDHLACVSVAFETTDDIDRAVRLFSPPQ